MYIEIDDIQKLQKGAWKRPMSGRDCYVPTVLPLKDGWAVALTVNR